MSRASSYLAAFGLFPARVSVNPVLAALALATPATGSRGEPEPGDAERLA
jgi:hypothetical protein